MSQEELHSLYGELGNKSVEAIRMVCRNRLIDQPTFHTIEIFKQGAKDCRTLAKKIRSLNGSERAANSAERMAKIHDYYAGEPGKVHSIVKSKYKTMYKNVDVKANPNTTFNDEDLMCPYEESGSKKACWTCHLPADVWRTMERQYEKDTFGDSNE